MRPGRWLVVSDLDGTLLDHFSYAYGPAMPALHRLRQLGIPLVLNTSKTRAELLPLRQQLGNGDPFIVENGSAVFIPRNYFSATLPDTTLRDDCDCRLFGASYSSILQRLKPLRERYRFESFCDWDQAELMEHTGLGADEAGRALAREFSEPLLWRDSQGALADFRQELASRELTTLQGGRFLHVLGACDKGQSLDWLRHCYQGARPEDGASAVGVIALGDSDNDIAMLAAAEVAVVIRSPRHPPPAIPGNGRVIVSAAEGPEGWNETINALLDELFP